MVGLGGWSGLGFTTPRLWGVSVFIIVLWRGFGNGGCGSGGGGVCMCMCIVHVTCFSIAKNGHAIHVRTYVRMYVCI